MIGAFVGGGALMLTVIGVLFKVNHDFCKRNEEGVEENRERYHAIDKKLDILISTLEYKYPTAVKKAKKENGESAG